MPFNSFVDYPMSWKPDRDSLKRPIYKSLAAKLEQDIASNVLLPGTKLPPQRELADFLDINFTTVTRAYRICELKGLLYAVVGSGTFVSPNATASLTLSANEFDRRVIDIGFVSSFEFCNYMLNESIKQVSAQKNIENYLDYNDPTGMPSHKGTGIQWLREFGVETDGDHLAIVSGTQNGIALALFALFQRGNRIAVDYYTYPNLIALARSFHIQLVPINSDDEGMLADELEMQQRLNPIQGIFLMPSCTNPTTKVISSRRRDELAELIRRYNMILIEDDIHAFLAEDDIRPMVCRIPENTVYIQGTTKSICSGLRVAYMVYPDAYKEALMGAIFNVNVKTSSLDVEIISNVIRTGKAYEIVQRKREIAKARNDIFYSIFPEIRRDGHPLSLYRWIPFNDSRSGASIEREFEEKGIRIYHSDHFLAGKAKNEAFIRVSLAAADTDEQLEEGLYILKNLYR